MTITLSGKSILFIGRNFFGYDRIIRTRLIELGASVDYVADVPYTSNLAKAALRMARPLVISDASRRILNQISNFGRTHYHYVFSIIGEGLDPISLLVLRSLFPRASFRLHIWDAINNNREALVSNFRYFDSVSSFDRFDSDRLGLQFRPLFFSPAFDKIKEKHSGNIKYDACFVGTAHSDRSAVLYNLKNKLHIHQRNALFFQYLQARWLYYVYNALDRRYSAVPIGEFSFTSISQAEVAVMMSKSKVVIDIPHSKQSGLTIRSLECLGMGLKLATTNPTALDYDFYDPSNIYIMSRSDPSIPEDFFESDYKPVLCSIRSKYSLDNWIREIFDVAVE